MKVKLFFLCLSSLLLDSFVCSSQPLLKKEYPVFSRKHQYIRNQALLLSYPKGPGTVGTILLAKKGKDLYMLLARECKTPPPGKEKDTKWLNKKEKFSDLGGSTNNQTNQTFLTHLQRELKEESMGKFELPKEDILKNAYVLFKYVKKNNREIVYIIYLLPSYAFVSQNDLNNYRASLPSHLPLSYFEKDLFLWVKLDPFLDDNLQNPVKIIDWEGKEHVISLRDYFVEDALKHPEFKKAILYFKSVS